MADEYVPASPITMKTKKRKGGLLHRRAKKHRAKSEQVPESTSSVIKNAPTVSEQQANESENKTCDYNRLGHGDCDKNLNINALYWPESDGEPFKDLKNVDIFYEAKFLELASQPLLERKNNIPLALIKEEFSTIEVLSQQILSQSPPAKDKYDTQFPSESEFVRVCEVVDAVSDLHQNVPRFSQWDSPLDKVIVSTPAQKTSSTPEEMEVDTALPSVAQQMPSENFDATPKVAQKTSSKPGTSYARRKYGREIEKAARKRIKFYDDSDSKSSLASELSLQSDDAVQFTPLDKVDLDQSIHVQENLHNLNSFFSQSFVEDDVDKTTNGVFRYIMLLKSKRKDVRMIHWFRSGKNFEVNDTRSSKSWEGFPSCENMTSTAVQSCNEDVHNLLGEDDEFFAELSDNRPVACSGVAAIDVDSILRNADRVLQEVSEYDSKIEDAFSNELLAHRDNIDDAALNGMNIDTLLNGYILATPKMAKFSDSSLPESSPWIMRPKLHNSITASDIEWEGEPKFHNTINHEDSPSAFNTTFIISKSPTDSKMKITNENNHTTFEQNSQEIIKNLPFSEMDSNVEILINQPSVHTKIEYFTSAFGLMNQETSDTLSASHAKCMKTDVIFPGFQSASGKKFEISEKALKTAEKLFGEEMELSVDNDTPVIHKFNDRSNNATKNIVKADKPSTIPDVCFSSKYVGCDMKKEVFTRDNLMTGNYSFVEPKIPPNNIITGFTSASGSKLFISNAAQEKADRFVAEVEKEFEKPATAEIQIKSCKIPVSVDQSIKNRPSGLSTKTVEESIRCSMRQKRRRNTLHDMHKADNIENMSAVANYSNSNVGVKDLTKLESISAATASSSDFQPDVPNIFDPPINCGFQSASGKSISISEKAKERALKMLLDEMNVSEDFKEIVSDNIPSNVRIPAAIEPTSKHANETSTKLNGIQKNLTIPRNCTNMCGFTTASGSAIKISEVARSKAEKMLAEIESSLVERDTNLESFSSNIPESASKKNSNDGLLLAGFNCASGKAISVSKAAVDKAEKMMAEIEVEENNPTNLSKNRKSPVKQSTAGFQSASGKTLQISKDSLAKAEKMIVDEEDNMLANLKLSQINNVRPQHSYDLPHSSGNTSNTSKSVIDQSNVLNPRQTTSLVKRVLRSNSIDERKNGRISISPCLSPANKFGNHSKSSKANTKPKIDSPLATSSPLNSSTPQRSISVIPPTKSRLSLSSKRFKPPSSVQEKPNTPMRSIPLHMQIQTPNFNEFFESVDTSTPKNKKGKSRARQNMFTLSQEVSASTVALLDDEADLGYKTKSVQKINWDLDIVNADEKVSNIALKTPADVLQQRAVKRREQSEMIKCKSRSQGLIKAGDHYVKKTQSNRTKLNELESHQKNHFSFSFDFSKVLDFRFKIPSEQITALTEDNSYIVPDDRSTIGFEEIKNAFLSLPSVVATLIPRNWLRHHYGMILNKLHWLEAISPGFLTPQNVCLQLKYRYDHELDRAHRSTLKRILECDDSAAKRMVLLVLAVHKSDFNAEIELTDRWYSVKASIDPAMLNLIDSGKVRVGTKLMIQSAELLNCEEGCDPLEVPSNVRLKIHTNSTRRAKWNLKLGYYKVQRPFLLNLDQVCVDGKLVTRLEVCILRVYPSVYLKGSKGKGTVAEFHSEKVEQQLKSVQDVSKLSNIETIFSQVQKELDVEERKSSKGSFGVKKNIKDVSDPAELYNMIRWEGDTSEIEAELSCVQRTLLSEFQEHIYAKRMKEVQKRVQAKLQNKPNCQETKELFKVRVIDYHKPNVSAVLSIWSPHHDIKNLLQERTAVEATHLISKDHHSYEIQLTSTKYSQFKSLCGSRKHQKNQRTLDLTPENLFRCVTKIKDIYSSVFHPAFNELDTYGLIVMIDGDRVHQVKRFQPVYLADADGNMLCLNFWNGVEEYGYGDTIQIHRFVAASNLQWRSNSACGPIRIAFVTSTTTFTEKPRNQDMLHALDTMKADFQNNYGENTRQFIETCQGKIKEIKSRPKNPTHTSVSASSSFNASTNLNNTNNSSMNSLVSTSMNASTSLNNSSTIVGRISVQERVDKLNAYGNPPELSPLPLKFARSVRRGFKVPVDVTANNSS